MKSKLVGFVMAMPVLGILMTIYGEGAIRASPQPRPKTKEETARAASEEFVMKELNLKAKPNKDQITQLQLERIFVSNEGANKITVVDGASLRILTSINIGPKPHNLAYSEGFVFVATQGSNEILAVDVLNLHQVRRIFIGTIPHDVAAEDGQQVLVLSPSGMLTLVELPSGKVRQQVKLKGRPHNLALVGDKIWITDITAPLVHIVNIQKKMVVRRASLPGPGHALALHPTVQEVWITPWASNEIAILDAHTYQLKEVIKVGNSPSHKHIAITPDGQKAWITEPATGTVYIVDILSRRLMSKVHFNGSPHHVAVNERRAYVAVSPSSLAVVDAQKYKLTAQVLIGKDPHDVIIVRAFPQE